MNDNFDQLLEQYLPGEKKAGDEITAKITRKELEYSYLDINDKVEGRIRSSEIKDCEVGEDISVQVIRKEEDFIIVSKLALDRIRELDSYNVSDIVYGSVIKKIKGGYTVKIKNNNAFLPLSLAGAKSDELLGCETEFLIKEKNRKGLTLSKVDLTRKEVFDYLDTIELGDVVKVTVNEILDFGVIVKLGPTTGLIHISEISWSAPKDINEILKVGQELDAKIIELNKQKAKIKLSIKQLQENPWNKIQKTYTVGEKRKGIIKEVLDFGLVVEISETKDEGFMHISDITYRKYFKLDKSFKVGDEIEFVILELNNEKQRISLSSRLILDEKWNNIEEHIKLGEKYKGKVIFAQNYGMFVEIETGIEAFIRKSDYSWTKETAKDYVEDDIVEFLITNIDLENKKIAASIKDLYESPWTEVMKNHQIGDIISTTIVDKIENGLLAQLSDNFKGLVLNKEIVGEPKIGDVVDVMIIDANEQKNSIILSMKKIDEQE